MFFIIHTFKRFSLRSKLRRLELSYLRPSRQRALRLHQVSNLCPLAIGHTSYGFILTTQLFTFYLFSNALIRRSIFATNLSLCEPRACKSALRCLSIKIFCSFVIMFLLNHFVLCIYNITNIYNCQD